MPDPSALATTIAECLAQGPSDAYAFEHTLAALVRAVRADRESLRAALLPILDKGLPPHLDRGDYRDLPLATPLRQFHALAVNAVWLPVAAHRYGYGYAPYATNFELVRIFRRLSLTLDRPPGMDRYALRTPADILTLRLAELAARIADPSPAQPVSTPTDAAGWIDAHVLVARIAEAESAGWQPWPLDFDQALLRLAQSPDPAAVHAAHRLVSPAGRRLAGWLRGGRPTLPNVPGLAPEPPAAGATQQGSDKPDKQPRSARTRPLVTLPDPPSTGWGFPPSTLIHLLRRGWYPPTPMADGSCWTACWPALLPARPDLIAIAVAWHPRHADAHGASCPAPLLAELARADLARADQDEAHAEGTFAAIARALTSRSPAKRADAAQAFAALATSGSFNARRFAAALATFATRTDRQVLRAAVPALEHLLKQNASTTADSGSGSGSPASAQADNPATTHSPAGTRNSSARVPAAPSRTLHPADVHVPATHRHSSTHSSPTTAADRAVASAIGMAILAWLPAILPPAVDQPLPYTSHLLKLAADALTSARVPKAPTRKPPPPVSATAGAAIDVLTSLAHRPGRSPVSDAASNLLAVLAQP